MTPSFSTSSSNNFYLSSTFGKMSETYKINQVGGLIPVNSHKKRELRTPCNVGDLTQICIDNLDKIHQEYKNALIAIGKKLSWTPPQERDKVVECFEEWAAQNCSKVVELDLSGLGLKILPPQMKLFVNINKLNLSTNQLRFLLPELQFCKLKELNISDNSGILNIPKWLLKIDTLIK